MNAASLAVVIPAYKGRHLALALESFAAQTDQRFRIYVADDGSPEDLATIVEPYRARLDLVYRRFPDNLGHVSLIRHWDRAIRMSSEFWVWLFSDDDMVTPDCVAEFHKAIAGEPQVPRLYRFQCTVIDDDGGEIDRFPDYAPEQNWHDCVLGPLKHQQCVVIQNVIFPRDTYEKENGFYDFPRGYWSDYVTWARFAVHGGIRTLAHGRVLYRAHIGSIGGSVFHGMAGKREIIDCCRSMLMAMRVLCKERGQPEFANKWMQLIFYCGMFRYMRHPLTREESQLAIRILRELWPTWPGLREGLFWWNAARPYLRQRGWYRRVASWRSMDQPVR